MQPTCDLLWECSFRWKSPTFIGHSFEHAGCVQVTGHWAVYFQGACGNRFALLELFVAALPLTLLEVGGSSGSLWAAPAVSFSCLQALEPARCRWNCLGFFSDTGPLPVRGLAVLSACSNTDRNKAWAPGTHESLQGDRGPDLDACCAHTWLCSGYSAWPVGFQPLGKWHLLPRCFCGPHSRDGTSVD